MSDRWLHAFDAFAERKTQAALQARLPPYVTVDSTFEAAADMVAVASPWTATRFDGPFFLTRTARRDRPACSLVFVQSSDGNTVTSNPSALGGGETDLHVVYEGLSRVAADAVLAGAGTVRDGGVIFSVWHPELIDLRRSLGLPRHPIQVVATRQGMDVETGLLFNAPEIAVLVLTTELGAERMQEPVARRPWIRLLTMPPAGGLPHAFRELRRLGVQQLSGVGGRTLAAQLLRLKLIDDVYLTTAPYTGGQPGTPMYDGSLHGILVLRKRGTGEELGVVFEHFHVRSGDHEQ